MAVGAHETCPELHQMLGAFLHQDFDLEYRTAENALIDSVVQAAPGRLARAATELRAHRPPRDDEETTRRFVGELCDYHPQGDGLTHVAWVDHVQAVLDGATGG
ncbi:MAG: contact-dependent growth inhibition system immunity protein [Acidimicrobiales bacterium]